MNTTYRSRGFTLLILLIVALFGSFSLAQAQDGPVIGVSLDRLFLGREAEMVGVRAGAEELGVTLLESVADDDAQEQNAQIQSFISQGVDAIMIVAVDQAAIETAIEDAVAAGIPVVTFDRELPGVEGVSYHSGLDSYADGLLCGQYIASQNDGSEPRVVLELLGALNDQNAIDRSGGFNEGLAGQDNLTIIQAPTEWNAETALAAVENAFQSNPDIWAIFIPSDFMMDSIETALRSAGRFALYGEAGHVHTCAIDGAPPGYEATAEGWNDAVVALNLAAVGRGALEAAVALINGETLDVTKEGFPGTLYTHENIVANAADVWGAPQQEAAAGGFTFYMLPKAVSIAVFDVGRVGAEEAAAELGDTVIYGGPTEADVQQQIEFISTAAAQGVDGLLISSLDPEAVVPALNAAAEAGVTIMAYDSDVNPEARVAFASTPDAVTIGRTLLDILGEQTEFSGQFAIISGAPTATNQNAWIAAMEDLLANDPQYANMELVEIIYAYDDDAQAAEATQNLLQAYPELRGIINPSIVNIVAAARVVEQQGLCQDVIVTGLGLPNLTRPFINSGCMKEFAFWNFVDLGYLSVYMAHAILSGEATGAPGETISVGRLGERTFDENNTVYVGELIRFNADNIDEYDF
jgi:rhamnose ABC transporter rhamnose-binding protein